MNLLWWSLLGGTAELSPSSSFAVSDEIIVAQFNITKRVYSRERLTVTSGAVKQLTQSKYNENANTFGGHQYGVFKSRASAAFVLVVSGSGNMSFTVDGTDPTAGTTVSDVGKIVAALDTIVLESAEAVQNFKAIAVTTNAIIEVWYLR